MEPGRIEKIQQDRAEGKTLRRVGHLNKRACSTVWKALRTSPAASAATRGGPRKHSREDDVAIVRHVKRKKEESLPQTVVWVRKHRGLTLSPPTISRILRAAGLVSRRKVEKPMLSDAHKQLRLEYATENQTRDWMVVLFCDETTFQVGCETPRVRVKKGERVVLPTVKHPPKLHAWAGVSYRGKTEIFVFTGILTAERYEGIIEQYLVPALKRLNRRLPKPWLVQQDNDPKHNAKRCVAAMGRAHIDRVLQPPQSPDLNPIENLWKTLKERVYAHKPKTAADLRRWVLQEWEDLKLDDFRPHILSMPRRCEAVIAKDGDSTKY